MHGWRRNNRMNRPALEFLTTKENESRYTLVVASAKRARQLIDGAEPKVDIGFSKPVVVALAEINAGKIGYEKTKDGIK